MAVVTDIGDFVTVLPQDLRKTRAMIAIKTTMDIPMVLGDSFFFRNGISTVLNFVNRAFQRDNNEVHKGCRWPHSSVSKSLAFSRRSFMAQHFPESVLLISLALPLQRVAIDSAELTCQLEH